MYRRIKVVCSLAEQHTVRFVSRGSRLALVLLLSGLLAANKGAGHGLSAEAELVPVAHVAITLDFHRQATTPIYLLAGAPGCPDAERPCGVPLARTDWVITKDYAAHGGPGPWGAVDFAFWWNRDAAGTPVLATHSGRVRGVGDDPIYGNRAYVQNTHWTTIYSHLQTILVPDDQWVTRGQVIGLLGSTGHSSGPHVDYEVWQDQANHNPHEYCACGQAGAEPVLADQPLPDAAGGGTNSSP